MATKRSSGVPQGGASHFLTVVGPDGKTYYIAGQRGYTMDGRLMTSESVVADLMAQGNETTRTFLGGIVSPELARQWRQARQRELAEESRKAGGPQKV